MIKSPEEEKVIAELLQIEERIPANLPEVPRILTKVSRNIVKLDQLKEREPTLMKTSIGPLITYQE